MRAVLKVVDPDAVVMKLTCEARVETWRKIRSALNDRNAGHFEYDVSEFIRAVDEAIRAAEGAFCGFGVEKEYDG